MTDDETRLTGEVARRTRTDPKSLEEAQATEGYRNLIGERVEVGQPRRGSSPRPRAENPVPAD